MRPIWRLMADFSHTRPLVLATASCLLAASCSVPEITLSKNKQAAVTSFTSFSGNNAASDKRYLTTVHIHFSESKDVAPLSFDIRRDKRAMVAAKLFESEETKTVLHLGYTRSDGPIVGCHFSWRF